jgi:lipopolysaccharide export system protein LptA
MGWRLALGAAAALASVFALSSPAAWAQSPIGSFGGLRNADSKKPIDIEADRLEVDDKKHTAVFIGNVSVTQGDNNLKAPRLEVFYETAAQAQAGDRGGNASKAADPVKRASAGVPADPISSGQIKLIHASGGTVVVTSTRDGQEATGDDAIYDVNAQKITMTGKKVVLRQSLSVLEGTKLEIDLNTGKANLVTGSRGSKPGRKRIRALFQQQTVADGRLINPLNDRKASPSSGPKKSTRTRSKPARKAAHPKKDAETPAGGQDWQTQSR